MNYATYSFLFQGDLRDAHVFKFTMEKKLPKAHMTIKQKGRRKFSCTIVNEPDIIFQTAIIMSSVYTQLEAHEAKQKELVSFCLN